MCLLLIEADILASAIAISMRINKPVLHAFDRYEERISANDGDNHFLSSTSRSINRSVQVSDVPFTRRERRPRDREREREGKGKELGNRYDEIKMRGANMLQASL